MFESRRLDPAAIAAVGSDAPVPEIAGFEVADLDEAATITAFETNEAVVVAGEVRRLALAAHWADLRSGDAVDPQPLPGRERAVQIGGDGTPDVGGFAAADLGPVLASTAGSASRSMADALDLRHRLPRTWAACRTGRVPAYQARRVASQTRHLTRDQARQVDAAIAPKLGAISWGRLNNLLDGLICAADPEGADKAAEQAARERFVRLGRTSEHGLTTIWAKVTAGDGLWGNALVTRLAEILRRGGDLDSLDVRRSKAFGVLISQPAEALRLLNAHQDDDDPDQPPESDRSPEPDDEPEPEDDGTNADDADPDMALRQAQGADSDDDAEAALRQAQGTNTETEAGSRSLRIGPTPFDPAKARPRAVLYVHISEEALRTGLGVARVEEVGPVLLTRLRPLVGDRCQILLRPVIDLNDTPPPVDSYEIPQVLREHLRLRQPVDVFPYAAGGSRRTDLDHTIAYVPLDRGGPPGQTAVEKLGPLVGYHHRVKTHGRWRLRQPEPGSYLWRSPQGRIFLVNASGTHPLGRRRFARQIWRAAKAPPRSDEPPDNEAQADKLANESGLERALRGLIDAHALAS